MGRPGEKDGGGDELLRHDWQYQSEVGFCLLRRIDDGLAPIFEDLRDPAV
jgi:hypothetical protein